MCNRDAIKSTPPIESEVAEEQNEYLDEALEETFPASDPIAPGHSQGATGKVKPAPGS